SDRAADSQVASNIHIAGDGAGGRDEGGGGGDGQRGNVHDRAGNRVVRKRPHLDVVGVEHAHAVVGARGVERVVALHSAAVGNGTVRYRAGGAHRHEDLRR